MPSKPLPDVERLRHLFCYESATGRLLWRTIESYNSRAIVGTDAGCFDSEGYRVVKFGGRIYKAHRIIWKMMTGDEPPELIDHKNARTSDNRWTNLRPATPSQNQSNRRQRPNGPSKGVCWHKRDHAWQASIKADGRSVHLGLFELEAAAHAAYAVAATRLFGEFARTA